MVAPRMRTVGSSRRSDAYRLKRRGTSPSMPPTADSQPIRFGNYLSEALSPFYQGVVDYVGRRLHRRTLLETPTSAGDIARGPIDFAFL
jgi:hypothetical protein